MPTPAATPIPAAPCDGRRPRPSAGPALPGPRIAPQLRALALACLTVAIAPAPVAGGSMNLSWDECGTSGAENRAFACNTNAGSQVLVASFDPPIGLTKVVGLSAVIDIRTASGTLPPWWQVTAGSCRAGAMSLDFNVPTFSCVNYWAGAATGSLAWVPGYGGADIARILISGGIPEAMAGPMEAGTENYAFRLVIDHRSTIGPGTCAGCLEPACIILTSVWLYQSEGRGDHPLCSPRDRNFVSWHGGVIASLQCPPSHGPTFPPDCLATPTQRRSWGLIKGLYR